MARRVDLRRGAERVGAASALMDPKLAQAVLRRREQQLQRWVQRSPEHPASGTEVFQGRLAEARVRQEAEAAVTDWPSQPSVGSDSTSVPPGLFVGQGQGAVDHQLDGILAGVTSIGHRRAGILGIRHVSLRISNLDRSTAWYASVLGFEERFRDVNVDRRACVMTFPGGDLSIGLVEHASGSQHELDPRRHDLDQVAFTVASHQALEQWETDLTATGVDHSGVVEVQRGELLSFNDADGTSLALFWERS